MSENGTYNLAHVRALAVQPDRTSEYTIHAVASYAADDAHRERPLRPVLVGRHAGEGNKALRAALNAANAKRVRGRGRTDETDEERGRWGLEIARSLWPRHVFTELRNFCDMDGTPLPSSPDAIEAFLRALPDDLLVGVIRHFVDHENFRGDAFAAPSEQEVSEYAGN